MSWEFEIRPYWGWEKGMVGRKAERIKEMEMKNGEGAEMWGLDRRRK